MNNDLTLLEWMRSIYIEALDTEIEKSVLRQQHETILEVLTEIYLTQRLHTFFVPRELVQLTQRVFETPLLREFLLELTDRFTISVSQQPEALNSFIRIIENGYLQLHGKPGEDCLMPESIQTALVLEDLAFTDVLRNNPWLLMLMMLVMWFKHSTHFQAMLNSLTNQTQ